MSRRSARVLDSAQDVCKEVGEDKGPSETPQDIARTPKRKGSAKSTLTRRKRTPSVNLDARHLLQNPKSPLISTDLNSIFTADTWTLLSPEEQRECLSLLPDVDKIRTNDGLETLVPDFFTNNPCLHDSLRDFQERLAAGLLTPLHIKKLNDASRDRAEGKADTFKDEQFERFWGEKQRLDHSVTAGETSSLKLATMITNGIFQVGDTFRYARTFGLGRGKARRKVVVEKECLLVAMTRDAEVPGGPMLTFKIPTGEYKFLRPRDEAVETGSISNLAQLENSILEIHAHVDRGSRTNGNSWKTFRLHRKAADLGSLWEVRERAFHL